MHDFNAALTALENRLLELHALAQLGLYATEGVENGEFSQTQSTLCTLFYIMLDMISDAQKSHGRIFLASGQTR